MHDVSLIEDPRTRAALRAYLDEKLRMLSFLLDGTKSPDDKARLRAETDAILQVRHDCCGSSP